VIRNNTLQARNDQGTADPSDDDPMNAVLQIGSALGDVPVSGLVFANNWCTGGNYSINGGSWWVADAVYRDNVFVKDSYRYGVKTNMGSGSKWENNRYDDGTPIR
jgi:hypothetical protein